MKYMILYRGDPMEVDGERDETLGQWEFQTGFEDYVSAVSEASTFPPALGAVVLEQTPIAVILGKGIPPECKASAWEALGEALAEADGDLVGDKTSEELIEICRKKAAEQRAKAKADPDPPPRLV